MWSASSPWPVISWNSTPPKPPPTTTGIAPAGAGSASSRVSAIRAARSAVPAERLESGLDGAVAAGDDLDAEPHTGAVVGGEPPVGVGDRDPAAALRIARLHLG